MPVTLEQAKNFAVEDYDPFVIDSFRAASPLLDLMEFDTAVNPAGGGGTLTYGYQRTLAPARANFRKLNAEFTESVATTKKYSVELAPIGTRFKIDRVLAQVGPQAAGEVAFQIQEGIKANSRFFNFAVINGDTGVNEDGFDGLSKALTDSETEIDDEFTFTTPGENGAYEIMEAIDALTGQLDGDATAIIGNAKAIAKVRAAARRANQYVEEPTKLLGSNGQHLFRHRVGGVTLIDAGTYTDPTDGTTKDVIPTESGVTSLYAIRGGRNGFHGVTTTGNNKLIEARLPDFSTPGSVKEGEVALGPVAVALKSQRAAAVLRKVRVAAS